MTKVKITLTLIRSILRMLRTIRQIRKIKQIRQIRKIRMIIMRRLIYLMAMVMIRTRGA